MHIVSQFDTQNIRCYRTFCTVCDGTQLPQEQLAVMVELDKRWHVARHASTLGGRVSRLGPVEIHVQRDELIARAQDLLGHTFADNDLLITSLTHASCADSRVSSNERLEFLGDAVLGMVVCDTIYRDYSDWLEGELTKLKSVVVSRRICAIVADEIGLTDMLLLGNGVVGSHKLPTSLRAAVYESVIGALYIDGGFEIAQRFILKTLRNQIELWSSSQDRDNYKSALQQFSQQYLSTTPRYEALDEKGPDHSKCFEVCVVISRERFPSAWGPSKKEAEQEAARKALEIVLQRHDQNQPMKK